MESTSPTAGSINMLKNNAWLLRMHEANIMYTLAQSLHMNTMYLNSAAFCQLLIMTIVHLVNV